MSSLGFWVGSKLQIWSPWPYYRKCFAQAQLWDLPLALASKMKIHCYKSCIEMNTSIWRFMSKASPSTTLGWMLLVSVVTAPYHYHYQYHHHYHNNYHCHCHYHYNNQYCNQYHCHYQHDQQWSECIGSSGAQGLCTGLAQGEDGTPQAGKTNL